MAYPFNQTALNKYLLARLLKTSFHSQFRHPFKKVPEKMGNQYLFLLLSIAFGRHAFKGQWAVAQIYNSDNSKAFFRSSFAISKYPSRLASF